MCSLILSANPLHSEWTTESRIDALSDARADHVSAPVGSGPSSIEPRWHFGGGQDSRTGSGGSDNSSGGGGGGGGEPRNDDGLVWFGLGLGLVWFGLRLWAKWLDQEKCPRCGSYRFSSFSD